MRAPRPSGYIRTTVNTSTMPSTSPPNLALIGCGAIAQAFYLPAIARNRALFGDIWLADPGRKAVTAAAALVPGRQVSRLADVPTDVELVIVATPNHLHYPLALEALE